METMPGGVTGPENPSQSYTLEEFAAFAAANDGLDEGEARTLAYVVESKMLIAQQRNGVDVQQGALRLEAITPEEVRDTLRLIERGEIGMYGFDERFWNVAARFASRGAKSVKETVLPWNPHLHPDIASSNGFKAQAAKQLARIYSRSRAVR